MAEGIYERRTKGGGITYYIRYEHQGKDVKEKIGKKSQGITLEIAKKALKSRIGDIVQGKFKLEQIQKPIPFSVLREQYEEWARANWRDYSNGKTHIKSIGGYFKNKPLSEITPWHIEKWKAERHKGVEASTVNRHITVLKHMFKKAVEWKLNRENPTATLKRLEENEPPTRYLTEEEFEPLLTACKEQEDQPWLHPLVVLAIHTGMRQGELRGLRWENVDLNRRVITLRMRKKLRFKTIPIDDTAMQILEDLNGKRLGENVVMYDWGVPIKKSYVGHCFRNACEQAGITGFRFHDLRHTFASQLTLAGVDLLTVSRLLGHKTTIMSQRYTHLSLEHKADAVAKLDSRMKNWNVSGRVREKVVGIADKSSSSGPPLRGREGIHQLQMALTTVKGLHFPSFLTRLTI